MSFRKRVAPQKSPEWGLVHFNLLTYPKNKQRVCSIEKLGGAFDWKSVFKIAIFLIFIGKQNPKTDLFADRIN